MCLVPCALCLVPCALCLVPCSLCLVPCALCLVPCCLCLPLCVCVGVCAYAFLPFFCSSNPLLLHSPSPFFPVCVQCSIGRSNFVCPRLARRKVGCSVCLGGKVKTAQPTRTHSPQLSCSQQTTALLDDRAGDRTGLYTYSLLALLTAMAIAFSNIALTYMSQSTQVRVCVLACLAAMKCMRTHAHKATTILLLAPLCCVECDFFLIY